MGRSLVVAVLALTGLLCAAGMGYAAYVVSRGSVAVPVTRLQQAPARQLTPARLRTTVRTHSREIEKTPTVTTPAPTTTVDDHGGSGGGHGGDD